MARLPPFKPSAVEGVDLGDFNLSPDGGKARAALDEQIRSPIRAALERGMTPAEVVFLLTRSLPELCPRDFAQGHLTAAYDLAERRAKG